MAALIAILIILYTYLPRRLEGAQDFQNRVRRILLFIGVAENFKLYGPYIAEGQNIERSGRRFSATIQLRERLLKQHLRSRSI